MATLQSPHRSPALDDTDDTLARTFEHGGSTAVPGRPSSIDMALRLEHELDAEHEGSELGDGGGHAHGLLADVSLNDAETRLEAHGQEQMDGSAGSARPVSLDPLVLAGIVANLRSDLSRVTQERDALADALHSAPGKEAELREALALLTERSQELEHEVERLRRKSQDDEDAINMLRTKVEESRRGLMRLQTESKRMSQMNMSIDTNRANSFLPIGGAPSSSKRASFVPLTGSGSVRITSHRRISSVSDPSFHGGVADDATTDATNLQLSPAPDGRAISLPIDSSAVAASDAKKARRSSAFFNAPSPFFGVRSPNPEVSITSDASASALTASELEALAKERDAARAELLAARQELNEAQEAREASEQCVAALRAFISEQGAGTPSGLLKLPPLPTDKSADAAEASEASQQKGKPAFGGGGWSFGKLFRQESGGGASSGSPSTAASPATEAAPAAAAPPPAPVGTPSPAAASGAAVLSRKIGGFFSGRAGSISSIASSGSGGSASTPTAPSAFAIAPRPPAAHGQQEPTLNGLGSDDEDDGPPEPLSPSHEHEAIGGGAPVVVREASTSASSVVSGGGADEREMVSLGGGGKIVARPEPVEDGDSLL